LRLLLLMETLPLMLASVPGVLESPAPRVR
jgi:hypothetical protein